MRTLAEWLVVPLVILPLLAAGVLLVWAQDAHRRDLAPYRQGGAERARGWIAEDRGFHVRRGSPGHDPRGVPARHPSGDLRIVVDEPILGEDRWSFVDRLPDGLRAEALSDPAVRLQVEAGRSPTEIDGVDEAALAFRDLLEAPSLPALRSAPLPVSSKLFLTRRWLDREPGNEEARAAARFLLVLQDYERSLGLLPSRLAAGSWRIGDLRLFTWGVPTPTPTTILDIRADRVPDFMGSPIPLDLPIESPTWVYPTADSLPEPSVLEAEGPSDAPVRLIWAFPESALPTDDIVWSGRLEEGFAGAYVFQAKYGTSWWQAPRVKTWVAPFAILLLASVFIPVALLVALRRRRRLDEARVRFLNELAHDLRTPLTSLRLHADLLTGGKARPDKKDDYAKRMAVEAARLSSLLGNLLDLTRLERGRRVFQRERVDLQGLLADARREFVAVFPDRTDDLAVEADAGTVQADRSALARVLANLLENAAKFTEPGTPIRVKAAGNQIVVSDDGDGIPPEERHRVFERYGRGTKAKEDGVPGTGLGLALVKELVEGMGGTVTLRGGTGATFEIRLGAADA